MSAVTFGTSPAETPPVEPSRARVSPGSPARGRAAGALAERLVEEILPASSCTSQARRIVVDAAKVLIPAIGEAQARVVLGAVVRALREAND